MEGTEEEGASNASNEMRLTLDELRAVAGFAAACAAPVLHLFETAHPDDPRPRAALDAALTFAGGGGRVASLRVLAANAHRAARAAGVADHPAARKAALSAGHAAAAAFLHPLPDATQVKHILGSAACATRAVELANGDDPRIGEAALGQARGHATPTIRAVLRRYPPAPLGRTRTAELLSTLDVTLRLPIDTLGQATP